MVREAPTLTQEAQEFAEQLDAINNRSLTSGAESPERIARLLKAHDARCAALARAEVAECNKRDGADQETRSRR